MKINGVFMGFLFSPLYGEKWIGDVKRNIAFEIRATFIADLIFPSNMKILKLKKRVSS